MAFIIVEEMTFADVEWAHRRACEEQEKKNWRWAEIGMRVARARDDKMMRIMEKAAEVIDKEEERQRGETRRAAEKYSEQIKTTETQMWVEAYKCMDRGEPLENLMWIYGAGACLAGILS
jgi:endo-alpha-1,4-polygalactosaminidase (GH114 family)